MKLNLHRPLIIFDIEATGLNVATDRIVQLSYIKVRPDGTEEQRTMLFNPETHIPAESSSIHHITDEMVAAAPTFREVAPRLAETFRGCDLAGFNSNKFDIPILVEEFLRAKVTLDVTKVHRIDVLNIYHKKERRDLTAAYRFYCGKQLTAAHSADADTRATYEVLLGQLDRYKDDADEPLRNDVAWLADYSQMHRNVDLMGTMIYDDQGVPIFNFGKYKGRRVVETLQRDPGFYSWVMAGQFTSSTKQKLTQIYVESKSKKK